MSVRTNLKIRSVIVALVLITAAPTFAGSIIYVDADAAGAKDGSSWADAYNHLQDALTAASGVDEIRVAQGIYKPDRGNGITPGDREATFQLISGVALKGGFAGFGQPDPNAHDIDLYETILSGDLSGDDSETTNTIELWNDPCRVENCYHVVTGSGIDASTKLDGFTITAGNATTGYGHYWHGGGMDNLSDSSPILINCTFSKNRAFDGSGMYNSSNSRPILINCIFNGNIAGRGGGMYDTSRPELVNCIFVANWAYYRGGGIYKKTGNITLTNCTLSGNTAGGDLGGGIYKKAGNITLTNCILWCNVDGTGSGELAQIYGETPVINYCCIKGWTGLLGGTSNIADDPMFVNADGYANFSSGGNYDFSLVRGSPCIGAGNNIAIPADIADLDADGDIDEPVPLDAAGGPRTINVVDIGAYEGAKQGLLLSNKSVIVPEGATAAFTVALAVEPLGTVEVCVSHESGDADIVVESGALLSFDSSNYSIHQIVTLAAEEDKDNIYGIAKIKIKGHELVTKEIVAIEQDNESVADILFIDQYYGDNGNDGLSKETAFETIQMGVDSAVEGDVVVVADGIYHSKGLNDPVVDFCGKPITVRSENGPENCILYKGDYVVYFHSSETHASVLSGFTIRDADPGAGVACWNSSPTIMNNIIANNWSEYGLGSVLLHNSSALVIGNVIAGNEVYGPCAGIYVCHGSSVTITNNTIVSNDGSSQYHPFNGGVYCDEHSTANINNCIFWNNGDYDLYGCSATYSCLEHKHPGTGNIYTEPLFIDPGHWGLHWWSLGDYHLLEDSPCINAGDPNYVPEPNETDLDGKPRVMGGRIDMGAYEYSPTILTEVRIVPRTINLASKGNWITCYIWLSEQYNVADIDPNSIFLEQQIKAEQFSLDEQQQIATTRFRREGVQSILEVGDVELTITGQLTDGGVFEAADTIKVIYKAGK